MKNQLNPKTLTGFFQQLKLIIKNFILKNRIKKNEGFRNTAYKDQLGYPTIGFGHLIKKRDKIKFKTKYPKKLLIEIFEKDFKAAQTKFFKHYSKHKNSKKVYEVLVEMIFQLGIKNVLKFQRFNKFINKGQFYMAALEMFDSKWHSQTPKRVEGLIKILLDFKNDR